MSNQPKTNEFRDPESLKPYPKQQEAFGPLNQILVQQLARDMDVNGLAQAPEILPDGTILTGHHRVAAAKQLGWPEVNVVVRHDLADWEQAELDHHFVTDNMLRNNYGPIAQARIIKFFVETSITLRDLNGRRRDCIAEAIAKLTGKSMSGKKVDRLLSLLKLPVSLQQLIENDQLTQAKALKIARLSKEDQQAIADAISEGADITATIDRYLTTKTTGRVHHRNQIALADRIVRLCQDLQALDIQSARAVEGHIEKRILDESVTTKAKNFVGSFNAPLADSNRV